jgi:hypothetical protein
MCELTPPQLSHLLQRIPIFELSYETISHKKVPENYDLCMSVPIGKKFFAWITHREDKEICYLLELNKDKRIVRGFVFEISCEFRLSLGTIFYGVILEDVANIPEKKCVTFIIEDVVYYEGTAVHFKKCIFKFNLIYNCLERLKKLEHFTGLSEKQTILFRLPVMWKKEKEHEIEYTNDWSMKISNDKKNNINYNIHHLQYRSLNTITPYLNYLIARNFSISKQEPDKRTIPMQWYSPVKNMDCSKPQYNFPTVFIVKADLQYDVYHLFTYGANKTETYFNIAYIPNYKSSIFMNSIFRNIKENRNIDYIEESEDEEDFENIKEDRYVDLQKKVLMECVFNKKFKKWTPVRNLSTSNNLNGNFNNSNHKVIHISKLISY